MAEQEEEQIYRRHWTRPTYVYVVSVCAAHACCMGAANARVRVKTRGWWDACLHLCGYIDCRNQMVTDVTVQAGELLWEPGW